jgi:hypothetical protein
MRKGDLRNRLAFFSTIAVCAVFLVSGCAAPVKTLDKSVNGPQLIVNPDTIRLGIAKVVKTKVVFTGGGFQPGDDVFINLLDVPLGDKKQNVPVASGKVADDGTFDAEINTFAKVTDILRADYNMMESIIIVSGPPIPEGTYTARAVSMLSDKTADCTLTIEGPSMMDGIIDWLGGLKGKIVKKE